jgi:acyl-CoA reductase-like NAD-dependent aldehyde dehydrogenase
MSDSNARHWISGDWVDFSKMLENIDPATGERTGTYADGGPAEAERAIKAALDAFQNSDWGKTVGCERKSSMRWPTGSKNTRMT